jgi:CBS domain-containing protein
MEQMPQPLQIKISDVMTTEVVAIDVNDTLDIIAQLFEKYDFDGMPVIDSDRTLRGVISAYDMILQSSEVHLPTMLKLIDQIGREKGDKRALEEHFGKLRDIKATSIMNPKLVTVRPDVPLEEAAKLFADYPKVSPLCVVDDAGKLVGIISHYDVIKFFNEAYLRRVVQKKQGSDAHAFKEFPTRSEVDVQNAVKNVESEFLLVQKRRPLIWKYAAVGMFLAGLVAATAVIIRIVSRGG